jgi:hypothetical protein
LERGLKLLVSDQAVDEVPGTDPFERETGLNVGLQRSGLFLNKTKLRLGVRSSLDAYASAAWAPEYLYRHWRLAPEARAYYRTDVGAGTIGSLLAVYRLKDRYRASQRASVEYGEKTDGDLEWLVNLSFAYLFEGDEEDNHRALFTRFSSRGTFEDGTKTYDWSPFRYRAPLYKKWIYWELGPEITWRRDDLWEPETTLRFGLSSMFWGTPDR